MRLEYIDPFIEASSSILGEVFNTPIKHGRPLLEAQPVTSKGVVILVGLTGDVEGRVIFDMEPSTAIRLAGVMNGQGFDSITTVVLDSIAELVNMIMGRAVSLLNNMGFKFHLTPPMAFTGNMTSSTFNIETLVLPLSTTLGEVWVNVAVRTMV